MQISFTTGTAERPPAPFYQLLVLAPIAPVAESVERTPLPVDRHGFAELLQKRAPTLDLDVEDRLTGRGELWWLKIEIRSLQDFTPAGLLRNIPELNWLATLRGIINDVRAGRTSPERLRDTLSDYDGVSTLAPVLRHCRRFLEQAPTSPPAEASVAAQSPAPPTAATQPVQKTPPPAAASSASDDGLDRLFDLIGDTGAPAQSSAEPAPAESGSTPARGAISGAIASLTGKPRGGAAKSDLITAGELLDNLLRNQLGLILAHPRLQALEQTWRGLRTLLHRINGDAPVRVSVMNCPTLAAAAECLDDALHGDPEATPPRDPSDPDLVLADFAAGLEHTAELARLADSAAAAMTPVLVSIADDLPTPAPPQRLDSLQDPANLLEQPRYRIWNARRDADPWRWLCGAYNDFVLRAPYSADARAGAGLVTADKPLEAGLWGHPGWLFAGHILARQQANDWPLPITGAQDGCIDDLPLRGDAGGAQQPLRHALSTEQARQLGEAGLAALSCSPNQDRAWIISAPSLRRIQPLADAAATRALRRDNALGAQLLRARLRNCIARALPRLPGTDAAGRRHALRDYLADLLRGTGASVQVQTKRIGESADATTIVTVVAGDALAPGLSVEFSLDLND